MQQVLTTVMLMEIPPQLNPPFEVSFNEAVCVFVCYRSSFHLLRKNEKLLRELKNLDSRQW